MFTAFHRTLCFGLVCNRKESFEHGDFALRTPRLIQLFTRSSANYTRPSCPRQVIVLYLNLIYYARLSAVGSNSSFESIIDVHATLFTIYNSNNLPTFHGRCVDSGTEGGGEGVL